ncbi:MAG: hypothetical protein EBW40_01375 [Gammaproteobacteria bacterium]|jgi:hypothetical protein|nr:hypothetical protein [Gammaproteobacteria bacterium]
MYLKRLTAQVTAIAIGCASTAIYADANYTQRAKEQAERAAAAAAIAADQVEAARVAEPATSSQGAETNVAPAGNNPSAQTSTSARSSTPAQTAQTDSVRTDAKQSNTGGNGPMEDQPLVIDVSNLYDEDGLGDLTMQWQVQLPSGGWQTIDGATSQSFTPRQNHVGRALRVVIQYVDGEGTLEVIETAPTGAVQNSNDLPQGLPIISGSSVEDNTIKIDVSGISDEDGVGQFTYQWERSSDAARWTPYQTNSSNPALLRLNQPEVGFAYRAIVSYVDGFGTTETLVTPATNMVQNIDDPVEGEVLVVGQAKKGQRLQIDTSNLSDDDGIANVRSTWEMSDNGRSWVSIPDVYGNSMTLAQAHVGSLIRIRAVVVDNFGSETTLYSQPTSLVQNVNSKPKGVIRILATGGS